MLGEEILGEMTSGHAGDAGDEDAHFDESLANDMPRLGCPVARDRGAE